MRTVYVQELMRLPLGKQGENGAARIVWQGLAARYQALYGSGAFTLTAKRCGDAAAYPVAVSTEGGDVVWLVRAADVANPGSGSCELTYTVDGAVAKSQTWSTYVAASISGDAPGEPPEEPAKAWFAAIQAQIGNLDDLTTKARASLVAAVNEAAKTGSGGAGSISMRTADGYIQYSTDDGANWANLIALAELKGAPGRTAHRARMENPVRTATRRKLRQRRRARPQASLLMAWRSPKSRTAKTLPPPPLSASPAHKSDKSPKSQLLTHPACPPRGVRWICRQAEARRGKQSTL